MIIDVVSEMAAVDYAQIKWEEAVCLHIEPTDLHAELADEEIKSKHFTQGDNMLALEQIEQIEQLTPNSMFYKDMNGNPATTSDFISHLPKCILSTDPTRAWRTIDCCMKNETVVCSSRKVNGKYPTDKINPPPSKSIHREVKGMLVERVNLDKTTTDKKPVTWSEYMSRISKVSETDKSKIPAFLDIEVLPVKPTVLLTKRAGYDRKKDGKYYLTQPVRKEILNPDYRSGIKPTVIKACNKKYDSNKYDCPFREHKKSLIAEFREQRAGLVDEDIRASLSRITDKKRDTAYKDAMNLMRQAKLEETKTHKWKAACFL